MGGFYVEGQRKISVINSMLDLLDSEDISFPNITEADIQDKSKANGLSKIIVATQSLWFIVQCIGRLARGLSLAPLEVTTLAVTACTFMLSIIWWYKPIDVRQPIHLDIKNITSSDREASNEEYFNVIYLERPNEVSGEEGGSRLETINSLTSPIVLNQSESERGGYATADEVIEDSSTLGLGDGKCDYTIELHIQRIFGQVSSFF
ncbi:hypothetical protein BDQ17DRAFT_1325648 [Cyathus striatus]|nr:hypothetical protein BDQ17DRAFT_1325648 [Cyathus striatus]